MNNIESPEQITNILTIVLGVMIGILILLIFVYLIVKSRENRKKKKENPKHTMIETKNIENNKELRKSIKEYTKQPIENFMEFDSIEDFMIIQKNGTRFLMVVECQGVNYDLMSGVEKTAVEEGFIEFLNTLRHQIQIYIQTRKVNLESSILTYKEKLKDIESEYTKMRIRYNQMLEDKYVSKEEKDKVLYDLTKQANLLEYGRDIVANTEKMSLNSNVLKKHYYIIIPYYSAEAGKEEYDKEEIKNIAFSELYTKAQSIIRTISACEVKGKILNSEELIDLLYVAYNRDDSEIFGIDRAMKAGYDELYTTAPDVLDKKMKELDKEIEKKAIELANEKLAEVKTEKQMRVEEKEETMEDLINDMAKLILSQNRRIVGEEDVQAAIKKIEEEEEGGKDNVREEKKKTRG